MLLVLGALGVVLAGPSTPGAAAAGAAGAATPAGPPAPASSTGAAAQPDLVGGTVSAFWLVASDGGVFSFGGAGFFGSTGAIHLNRPIVGLAHTPDSGGYWLVASDGGIFAFGDARFFGSTGNLALNRPVVGMAATPDGGGYWLVASDGGIFAFGDARFFGSTGNLALNRPVVGMAATPDGGGYWLVASDGGIFAFGDARFFGSTGNLVLNKPILAMAATPDAGGYWFVASDGGVFTFGDAHFFGSLGGVPQSRPIVGMATTADGAGYWLTNNNGAVTPYGDATYWGSAPQRINQPVVGMAEGAGNGAFSVGSSYPSGSFGYDISNFQCPAFGGSLPPAPHTIGIVEVEGASFGFVNPCLAQEANWAASGLNLYVFLTFGTATSSADVSCTINHPTDARAAQACNYGYNTAIDALAKANGAGVPTGVGWWLDVEGDPSWTSDLGANAALVQGAIDGLRAAGLNSVGIYASPGVWNSIVGPYQPPVPYWAASWQVNPATTCANVRTLFPSARLPAGPVQVVQFSSPSFPLALGGLDDAHFDNDYAC